MRVLHLDSGLDFRGGQQQVLHLAAGLARAGVNQHLMVRRGGALERRLAEAGLPFATLPFRSEVDLLSACQLRMAIARLQPDIVHAHDAHTLGLAALAWATGARSPIIAARRVAFPVRRNLLSAIKYRLAARRIVAVSQCVCELLVAAGIDRRRVDVVYDGIEPTTAASRQAARQKLGIPHTACLIGSAGQFVPEKGHEFLIRAFARIQRQIPSAVLALIGEGELAGSYRTLAQELGVQENVLFSGYVPDLRLVLSGLDIFVFPSLQEGLGSSLLIAMGCKVPVCASRTGGIPEIVQDGATGYLFKPGDADAIAGCVLGVLRSPQQGRDLAEAAALFVVQRFSVERMVEATRRVYANALGH